MEVAGENVILGGVLDGRASLQAKGRINALEQSEKCAQARCFLQRQLLKNYAI
jgi:hypothetical protein